MPQDDPHVGISTGCSGRVCSCSGGSGSGGGAGVCDEADKMIHELPDHPEGNDEAAEIGRDPRWIAHDLQSARTGVRAHLILAHLVLVKGQPGVTERVVHVDVHLTVLEVAAFSMRTRLWKFFGISVPRYFSC